MDERALKLKWLMLAHLYCRKQMDILKGAEQKAYTLRADQYLEDLKVERFNRVPSIVDPATIERLERTVFGDE